MLSPPFPPPPPSPPPLPLTPPPQRQHRPPQNQIVISKTPINHNAFPTDCPYTSSIRKTQAQHLLRPPRKTNPVIWFGAVLCLIFSLTIILSGIATLIIFLDIKPRKPLLDTPNASLGVIYFDSPVNFNSDLTILANFSNPNKKLDVRYEYLDVELYFFDSLIATRSLPTFSQRPGEARLVSIHMISSLVYLPPKVALELQKQVISNKVIYNIRGTFKVRVSFSWIHFHYWLHGRCQLEMTSPPTGILVARSCSIKRWKCTTFLIPPSFIFFPAFSSIYLGLIPESNFQL